MAQHCKVTLGNWEAKLDLTVVNRYLWGEAEGLVAVWEAKGSVCSGEGKELQ